MQVITPDTEMFKMAVLRSDSGLNGTQMSDDFVVQTKERLFD